MRDRSLKVIAGLAELDRTSLRERAMDRLRQAVTTREIAPGTRLVETELSAALGISRGTLREALRQLEHEGLIETDDRNRLTVRTVSSAELTDMFTVRSALEGLAAAVLSTRRDRPTMVRQLQGAVDRLQAADGSLGDSMEADLDFHRLLCALTGNTTLLRAWETLTGPMRMAILFAGPEAAAVNMSAARHQELVDAIATGDPHTAQGAVAAHMRQAALTLLDPSRNPPGDPSTHPRSTHP